MLALGCGTTVALRTVEAAATRALADWRSRQEAAAGTPVGAIPLTAGVMVKQMIPAGTRGLHGIRLATTAGGARRPGAPPVAWTWKVVRMATPGGTNTLVRSGSVTADDIDAEGWAHIDFEPITDFPAACHLLKVLAADEPGPDPVGLVLVRTRQSSPPAVVTTVPASPHAPAQPLPGTGLRVRLLTATAGGSAGDGGGPP